MPEPKSAPKGVLREPAWIRSLAILVIAASALIIGLDTVIIAHDPPSWWDMTHLFQIIRDWSAGTAPLYPPADAQHLVPGGAAYRYPPLWATGMVPLVRALQGKEAIAAWSIFSLLVFFGGLFFLTTHLGIPLLSLRGSLMILAVALFSPYYESFYGPTKEFVLVGLAAIAFVLCERGKVALASFSLALSATLKIYPILFALYFLLNRNFRILGLIVLWLVILNLLPIPLIGTDETITYYSEILPVSSASSASPENASLDALVTGAAMKTWFHHGLEQFDPLTFSRASAHIMRLLFVGLAAATLLQASRRQNALSRADRCLLFGSCIAVALLVIPVSWVNYQIFLLIPLIALAAWRPARLPFTIRAIAIAPAVAACIIMSVPFDELISDALAPPIPARSEALATTFVDVADLDLQQRIAARTRSIGKLVLPHTIDGSNRESIHSFLASQGIPDSTGRRQANGEPGLSTSALINLRSLRVIAGCLMFFACLIPIWLTLLYRDPDHASGQTKR